MTSKHPLGQYREVQRSAMGIARYNRLSSHSGVMLAAQLLSWT